MKLEEALKIIESDKKDIGFMVHFEKAKGCGYCSGFFPDKHAGEILI